MKKLLKYFKQLKKIKIEIQYILNNHLKKKKENY